MPGIVLNPSITSFTIPSAMRQVPLFFHLQMKKPKVSRRKLYAHGQNQYPVEQG